MTNDETEAARRAEFDAFYLSTSRRLVGVIYALTGDLADAEDAVQEAYARAWPRWSALIEGGDPTGWVRVVARRIAIGTWRRTRNRLTAHFRHGGPEPAAGISADHVALVAALRRLPDPQRHAIVLFHLCDLPGARVAEELGITEVALRARLNRARKELRRHLDDTHPGIPIGANTNR
ncbi:SigE family RNA polymerase sigma factor [Streptomyces sp. SID3343]|uniref:SigE family RNA polymerase sigma factor n=1 Tax=Streptomyces sp. SID3343 TaxID=2690260 RepID=UPI00136B959A|nr:SigE family RNA polymerase sigma factor [Streptomyces sp. SID3343]MYV99272.1 sigma-70 family RNA polymerase sigma factor [Streptomyces sp. SID3343]